MWGILSNVNVLLGIVVSLGTIIGTAITMIYRKRRTVVQAVQGNSSSATVVSQPSPSTGMLSGLDFWDKATVIGEGILEGLFKVLVAFTVTLFSVFCVLFVILIFGVLSRPSYITTADKIVIWHTFWTELLISAITGLIIGLMVGIVASVNEIKSRADDRRLLNKSTKVANYPNNSYPSSSHTYNSEKNTTQVEIANAPIMKSTGNSYVDRLHTQFIQQTRQEMDSWSSLFSGGTIILFASLNQLGEIVNAVDEQSWNRRSSTEPFQIIGKKQAYIKEYQMNNGIIYAAVFKYLDTDTGYVFWSGRKQPALALSQSQDVTYLDWR